MVGQPGSEVPLGSNESRALALQGLGQQGLSQGGMGHVSLVPGQGSDTAQLQRELRARVGLEGKGLLHNACKGLLSYTIPEKLWRDIKPS